MRQTKKIYQLDIIRSIAIILVLCVHAAELIFFEKGQYSLLDYDPKQRLIFIVLFTLGRLGVPIFMFLTGYLMLHRVYPSETLHLYYKNRVWKLYQTIVYGIIGLTIYEVVINDAEFSMLRLLKQLLLVADLPGVQTWYMPVILAIYLFIPFVANALKDVSLKIALPLIGAVYFYYFVIRDFNLVLEVMQQSTFAVIVDFGFVSSQGLLILVGWLLREGVLRKIRSIFLSLSVSVGLASLIIFQYHSFDVGGNYLVWYNNAVLIAVAFCLFELLTRIELNKSFSIFSSISGASFGIYWLHSIGQDLLWRIKLPIESKLLTVVLLSVTNLLLSFFAVKIFGIMRVKFRKLFLAR